MSILQFHHRPWAVFNPANKEHRRFYAQFVKHGSWGRCKYRFVIADDCNNLITMIQRKLVEHYVTKEFDTK